MFYNLKARISLLRMEEVLLERQLRDARLGQERYKTIEAQTDELLDACRTAIINAETALADSSTVM